MFLRIGSALDAKHMTAPDPRRESLRRSVEEPDHRVVNPAGTIRSWLSLVEDLERLLSDSEVTRDMAQARLAESKRDANSAVEFCANLADEWAHALRYDPAALPTTANYLEELAKAMRRWGKSREALAGEEG
jgi:hypothetical protein